MIQKKRTFWIGWIAHKWGLNLGVFTLIFALILVVRRSFKSFEQCSF